jgi:hypothetical protein
MSLSHAWRRLAERRERIWRGNRQPATHAIILVQGVSAFGKLVATVNGGGLVASVALIIAA